jgi:hypothetical protein
MFDIQDLYAVALWVVRIVLPVSMLAFVALRLFMQHPVNEHRRRLILNPKTQTSSIKQHALLTESRPLFRIEEQVMIGKSPKLESGTVNEVPYPREALLAARVAVLDSKPPELAQLDWGSVRRSLESKSKASFVKVASLQDEREYLRSLLEFRALKTPGIADASWEAWNREAQKILKGALLFDCYQVGVQVHDILSRKGILPDNETFNLLLEIALKGQDLTGAKILIDLMGKAGYVADQDLQSAFQVAHSKKNASLTWNRDAPEFIPISRVARVDS